MKKKFLLILLLVIAVVGWYGYYQYNRKNKDISFSNADYKIDAIALLNDFEKDTLANKKYLNKIVETSGNVKKVDAEGNPVIIFLGSADNMSSVKCSMDSNYVKDYQFVKPGNKIVVKGVCTGGEKQDLFGTDVTLNYCIIKKDNN